MNENEPLDLEWALGLLQKDKYFAKINAEDHRRIICEAIKFGAHLAEIARDKLGAPSGPESIRQMLSSLGCVLRLDEKSGLPGPMSRYEEDLSAALFFVRRIRETAAAAIEQGELETGWYDLYARCLARELFHHMEHTLSGKASQHITFRDRILGLVPVTRPVEATGEIACLVFVRNFLGLTNVPLLMCDA